MTVTLFKKPQPWLFGLEPFFASLAFLSLSLQRLSACRLDALLSRTVHNNRRDPYQWKEPMLSFGDTTVVCVHTSRRPSLLPANPGLIQEALRIEYLACFFEYLSCLPLFKKK